MAANRITDNRVATWSRGLLVAVAGLLVHVDVEGEDVVTAKAKTGRGTVTARGEIVDYTGQALTLRRSGGRDEVLEANRILAVETSRSDAHRSADEQFANHRFDAALADYERALSSETRLWVKRQLIAQIVWCLRSTDRTERAIDAFLQLLRNDPATMYYAAAPIAWWAEPPSAALESKAAGLLADGQVPTARLIGASILLPTTQRSGAMAALQGLLASDDSRVAFLAEAQLWRSQGATASADQLARWHDRWRRIPGELQAGPAYVLGQAYSRAKLSEEAALLFLRAPILEPRDRTLAPQALLAAGRELETIHQLPEATTVYREIVLAYGSSGAAATAQQRLLQLTKETPARKME